MKKLVVILIMGLCGSAVFAQDSNIIEMKKSGVKKAATSPEMQVKEAPIDGINIIDKKKMKSANKASLQPVKAIEVKNAEKAVLK